MKKVLLIIAAIVAVAIAGTAWTVKANDTVNKNNPVKIGNGSENKSALVIYQKGRSSYLDKIAEAIGNGLNEDGYNVVLNQPGDYLEKDLSKYNLVVFGTPVYAGQTSSQIKKYAESIENYGDAKVICFCAGADGNKDETEEFIKNFNGRAIGGFKVAKADFDKDRNMPIEKIRSLLN